MFPGTHRISIRKHLGPESQSVLQDRKAEFSLQRRARPTWGTHLGQQRQVEGPWAGLFASWCGDRPQGGEKWRDCPHRNVDECFEAPCPGTRFGLLGHRTVAGAGCGFLCSLHMSSRHTGGRDTPCNCSSQNTPARPLWGVRTVWYGPKVCYVCLSLVTMRWFQRAHRPLLSLLCISHDVFSLTIIFMASNAGFLFMVMTWNVFRKYFLKTWIDLEKSMD